MQWSILLRTRRGGVLKILVTGSSGFIGSHLCPELVEHDVVGVPEREDLLVPGTAKRLITDASPDLVIHLAAKVGRLFGEMDLLKTVTDNAGMTAIVASVCGELGIPLAYASSSEVYGDGSAHTWTEEQLHWADPHNLYGLSKRWGEDVCRLYAPDGLTILRLSMPYGPGHPPGSGRAALTQFLDCAMRREPITVHRGAERAWCWVGDVVRGIRMVLEYGEDGAWNIGRDDNSVSLRRVAEMACDLVGAPHDLIREVDPPARQTVIKRLCTDKLRSLGWEPEVELGEGMLRTLRWLENREREAA